MQCCTDIAITVHCKVVRKQFTHNNTEYNIYSVHDGSSNTEYNI